VWLLGPPWVVLEGSAGFWGSILVSFAGARVLITLLRRIEVVRSDEK
jgi:hypothetical protein